VLPHIQLERLVPDAHKHAVGFGVGMMLVEGDDALGQGVGILRGN